jgi:hypothetical protein
MPAAVARPPAGVSNSLPAQPRRDPVRPLLTRAHGRLLGSDVAAGHDLGVGYDRACPFPVPELNVFIRQGALRVWPVSAE